MKNTISNIISEDDALLTREEAANYLGTTVGTLATWTSTKRYQLPIVKVGRLVRYRLGDLKLFVQNRTQ